MRKKENIVFLSGLLCTEMVWEEVAKELEDNFNVSIISFKGCDSIEMMANKVLNTAPKKFILIGHSMGGRVALEVFKTEPKRVLKLGLFNTGVHPKSEAELIVRRKLLDLAKTKGIKAVGKQWLPPMLSEESLKNSLLLNKLEKMILSYSVDEFLKQIGALINRPDSQSILSTVDISTLLLSATEDKWSSILQHEKMQDFLKDSTLSVIENASHMAPVEQPKLVAKAIINFL
ncbi:MAG: hypothetical protein C0625_12590 [Arcobacter sp.]|nr:MAG: hypothetical protein C0625_12590 [Arcobacter sp.]